MIENGAESRIRWGLQGTRLSALSAQVALAGRGASVPNLRVAALIFRLRGDRGELSQAVRPFVI